MVNQLLLRIKGLNHIVLLISFFCTLSTILGTLLYIYGTLYIEQESILTWIYLLLFGTILLVFYYKIVEYYINILFINNQYIRKTFQLNESISVKLWVKRSLIILICWLPYLLLTLPGSVHGDYIVQLLQHFGNRPLDNHHPFLSTFLYGALFDAGKMFFSDDNGGVLLTVLFQSILLSSSLAFCVTQLEALRANESRCRIAMAFFCLMPIFPLYAFDCVKDTLACSVLILFFTQICTRVMSAEASRIKSWWISTPSIICMGLICSVLRNNFSYCILPALFCLQFKIGGIRPAIVSCLALVFLLIAWSSLSVSLLGIKKGNVREMLSVPMQQIAYCLTYHPKDITKEEQDNIQKLITVNLDEIPKRYTYKISDPVKSVFSIEDNQQLMVFFKTWLSIGIRHPRSYLTSFLRGNFGYWYPFLAFEDIKWGNPLAVSPEDYIASLHDDLKMDFSGEAKGLLTIHARNRYMRDSLRDAVHTIAKTPPLSLFFEPAFYIWVVMITLICVTKKTGCWSQLVLCGMLFLTCCASPDYSNVRYALPFYALAPLSILFVSAVHDANDESAE